MTTISFLKVIILSALAIVAVSLLSSSKLQTVKADFVNEWGCTIFDDGRNSCHPDKTPNPTPSDVQCPVNTVKTIQNSTVVCVSQNQTNNQTQNNNQTQSQSQGNTSSYSNSSSSSDNHVKIENNTTPQVQGVATVYQPTTTLTPSYTYAYSPKVVTTTPNNNIYELPKTGLPIVGWGLAALLPLGAKLRKFSARANDLNAMQEWYSREFKR